MNTPPLAAAIRKENVLFVDGEKADVKTAGKKRKASADLRSTYVPIAGASKDVDLKHKSAMKGNKIKKNQMTRGKRHAAATIRKENVLFVAGEKANVKAAGKKRKASTDLRSTYVPVAGASKDVDLKHKSAMKGNKIKKNQMTRGKRHAAAANRTTKKPNHIPIPFREDDENELFMMRMESLLRVPISKLKPPSLNDEKGYKTDSPDFNRSKLFPGPDLFVYTSEELEELHDTFDKARLGLKKYPLPELKLDDD